MEEYVEFIFTGTSSILEITLEKPFIIPEKRTAEIGLKNVSFYNSVPNVSEKNNLIHIRVPNEEYKTFELDTGAYEIDSLNQAILDELSYSYPLRKHEIKENFKLTADEATGRSVFKFGKDGYSIKFDEKNSLALLLGFIPGSEIINRGNHHSPNLVQITTISTLLFKFNLSEPNFVNNQRSQTIYSAVLDASPGHLWSRELSTITYKRLVKDSFSYLRLWITDSDHNYLELRSEKVTVTLSLKIK